MYLQIGLFSEGITGDGGLPSNNFMPCCVQDMCLLKSVWSDRKPPLMMEKGYRAKGWLGMLLGVRLYYKFCGAVLDSDGTFDGKIEELCRELGQRGKCK